MILGLRCSAKDYAFAILDGTKAAPVLVAHGLVAYPKGFSRVQSANWFLQELTMLLDTHSCGAIVIKGFEGLTKGNAFVERVENEAVAYLAAFRKGIKSVVRKVKSTIAKDLGLKGRAKYLSSTLDTTVINDYAALDEKIQDAVLAGWSGLP